MTKNNFYTIILGILYASLSTSFLRAEEFDYGSFPDPFLKDLQRIQQEAAFNAACLEDPDSHPECPGYTFKVIEEETIPLEGIEELFNLSIDSEKIVGKPEITIFNIEQYKVVGIAMTSVPELDLNYIVKKNDTLLKIANKFGVDPNNIVKVNNINPSSLQVGTILKIYSPPYMVLPAKQDSIAVLNKEAVSKMNDQTETSTEDSFMHQVQKGESLSKISELYAISVYNLLVLNPQLQSREEQKIYIGEDLIISKQNSIVQDDKSITTSWIEPYDYGSFWIVLAEFINRNKTDELMSYFRREFDDLLLGKTIRLRENEVDSLFIIEAGPYANEVMAEAVTTIFDSRLQDAKSVKLIDPNFRPSKDFSNFEPKSSAYKVNRGRNMALIQSLNKTKIYTVYEGDILGNENARVVKILPNKVIMSDLGTEITLMYNKSGISQSTGYGESE